MSRFLHLLPGSDQWLGDRDLFAAFSVFRTFLRWLVRSLVGITRRLAAELELLVVALGSHLGPA